MAIKRKALLVASPEVPGLNNLPGARADVINFQNYLVTSEGGAWEPWEIETLFNPTTSALDTHLSRMASADYAFVTFSGHGEHHVGASINETSAILNAKESCYAREINPRNRRHFVIIDCCRSVVHISKRWDKSAATILASNAAPPRISREEARRRFDTMAMDAEEGRVVAYSCNINQTAGEDPNGSGGYFSKAMVDLPETWAWNANPSLILTIPEAFGMAKQKTLADNAPQEAVLELGRRMRNFPYAISTRMNLL